MKPRYPEPPVIGRDWHASRAVTIAIHNRGVRKRRRARWIARIIETLKFWKA